MLLWLVALSTEDATPAGYEVPNTALSAVPSETNEMSAGRDAPDVGGGLSGFLASGLWRVYH